MDGQAACTGQPEALFFRSMGADLAAGVAVCEASSVRAQCYAFGRAMHPASAN